MTTIGFVINDEINVKQTGLILTGMYVTRDPSPIHRILNRNGRYKYSSMFYYYVNWEQYNNGSSPIDSTPVALIDMAETADAVVVSALYTKIMSMFVSVTPVLEGVPPII